MRAALKLSRAATWEEYLATEQLSPQKHEFIDGVIVAMAGGSPEHNAIGGRLAILMGARLSPGCEYFTPDQRFYLAARHRGRYSDGSIVCGKLERATVDRLALVNPKVVVEVLSPSTQGDDEGDKRLDFQTLKSLEAYVLVSQDARLVRVFRRGADAAWPEEPETYGSRDRFELPALEAPIAVDAVFDRILDQDGRSLLG